MADIVERLREYAREWTARAKSNAVVIEAADEIERLQRELSTARRTALLEAATLIDEGFDRGITRKQDTCAHGKFGWEDCDQCAASSIRKLAEADQ